MKNNSEKPAELKPFTPKKSASPFGGDPYNNRGGKGGKKGGSVVAGGGNVKINKSISLKKFSGGSGGDR